MENTTNNQNKNPEILTNDVYRIKGYLIGQNKEDIKINIFIQVGEGISTKNDILDLIWGYTRAKGYSKWEGKVKKIEYKVKEN